MPDTPPACAILLACLHGLPGRAQQALEAEGFWVSVAGELDEALWRLRALDPELLIIQTDGRQAAGWQACQQLVEAASQPVFVLVDDPAVEARVAALASGADDALSTPLEPLELVARARALLRRGRGRPISDQSTLRHHALELDLEGYLAWLDDQPLALTPLEFRLLRALLERPRHAFSRDELLARTHGLDESLASERSIDLHVTELRRKLGDSARAPRYIQTVRGVGYRLAPVRQSA